MEIRIHCSCCASTDGRARTTANRNRWKKPPSSVPALGVQRTERDFLYARADSGRRPSSVKALDKARLWPVRDQAMTRRCQMCFLEVGVSAPDFPYGASKLADEGDCSAYHGSFGLDSGASRFSNVYGPCS